MLRSTLLFLEQQGGSWEKSASLRALRRALLRTIWDLEGKHPHRELKTQRLTVLNRLVNDGLPVDSPGMITAAQ